MHKFLILVFLLAVGLTATIHAGRTAGAAAPAARLFDSPPPGAPGRIYLPLVARDVNTPTPAPCPQLLLNPGFETDQTWRMAVSAHPAGYSIRVVHSGLRSLRAGIDGTADKVSYSSGFQDVVIPAGTTDATLSFWWYPITAEAPLTAAAAAESMLKPAPELVQAVIGGAAPEGTLAGDLQYAVLADQSGNILQTMLWTRSNARTWQWASYPVSKSLIGRTVRVLFGVYNDGNGRSSTMFVDDVALTTCKPATPTPTATATPALTATPSGTPTATPTPTQTVTPSPTATATETPTATPTFTPTPVPTLPAPATLRGAPLQMATLGDDSLPQEWFLPPDGRLVSGYDWAAEPYPLNPALGIRAITRGADTLLAATDSGIFRRDPLTYRWSRLTDQVALQIAASTFGADASTPDKMWIVPANAPDQIWVSRDAGQTWERDDNGLQGRVVGRLQWSYNGCEVLHTVTERGGRYVIWEHSSCGDPVPAWLELATVPGQAVSYQPGGVAGSFAVSYPSGICHLLVGSSDGHLYRSWEGAHDTWESVAAFAAGDYPLLLNAAALSLIDLTTGDMQLYRFHPAGDDPAIGVWSPVAFPGASLPWGAILLPDGQVLQKWYGQPAAEPFAFYSMALTQSGALYANGSQVTAAPSRTDFMLTGRGVDFVGTLYSGARLTWSGASCTASETGFFSSDDKGLTWTEISSGVGRRPMAILTDSTRLLAATCTGPSISADSGATWRGPADLGWPLPTGAALYAVRLIQDLATWEMTGATLYAAGMDGAGVAFLYRAGYDAATGAVGAWRNVTPSGLAAPVALHVADGQTDGGLAPEIYLADASTVWLSADDGMTWESRSAGFDGATVQDVHVYDRVYQGNALRGILAATNRGLFIGPAIGDNQPWIPTSQFYTTTPIRFQADASGTTMLGSANNVFPLVSDFFYYLPSEPGATPTVMPTPSPTATATSTPTASPTPLACSERVSNGGFEITSAWTFPATVNSAGYTTAEHYSGARAARFGLLPGTQVMQRAGEIPERNLLGELAPAGAAFSSGYQTISLPASATQIMLTFWYKPGTADPANDFQRVMLLDPVTYAGIKTLLKITENDQVWKQRAIDLTEFRGRSVVLYFEVYNNSTDNTGRTWMYLDDVSVLSCAQPLPPTATRTATPSPSATATRTPSATPTATVTPSATPTPLSTPTATLTPTPTNTPTQSATPTQTSQATSTVTATATRTATSSATPTQTHTATQTVTSTSTSTPTATATATHTSTPTRTATATPANAIYGRLTYKDAVVTGISLKLAFWDGAAWNSTSYATTTDGAGRYAFTGVATISAGQWYEVTYGPNTTDPRYLNGWYGPNIETYTAGTSVHGGDFDIADVSLLTPPSGATVTLPTTFTWQTRSIAGDTYRHILFDPASDAWWWTDDLGYVGQFVANSLPPEIVYGKEYGWYVQVYNGPDSFGESYYYSAVTFKTATSSAAPRARSANPLLHTYPKSSLRGQASRPGR